MKKILAILLNVLLVIFLIIILLSLIWFFHGSFESIPNEEQQEKAKIAAGMVLFIAVAAEGILAWISRKMTKSK